MHSRWDDADAARCLDLYAADHGEDLALRVYTSQLIGQDERLVLHGGGNTSVKTVVRDFLGEPVDVLCVKGSGWDLGAIEPAGLPAVELEPLRQLRALDALSDEDMVAQVRRRLLDVRAPNPSVEALLHAYLPHKFVDHTHADAVLIVGNQPDGEARIREALGDEVVILPWIMPGFPLAKAVADAYEAQPQCTGVVLLKHGIFTFAEDGRASYEKMIELVDRVERYADERAPQVVSCWGAGAGEVEVRAARCAPAIRGALSRPDEANPETRRRVLTFRTAEDLREITTRPDCAALCASSPLTPDHVLRTKGRYLHVAEEAVADPAQLDAAVAAFVRDYTRDYEANARDDTQMLDPSPNVVVVPGLGLFAAGADAKAAGVAADIAEHTLRGKAQAAALGSYEALSPAELFEMEYWSLEQAKLGKKAPALLAGQVACVTGAAGAIGRGVAEALLAAGAQVCLTDVDEEGLERVRGLLAETHGAARILSHVADITDPDAVDALFEECALRFGGVDIVVPNAGIAHVSGLRDMDLAAFRRVVDVNLTGTMTVLKSAARCFETQRTGGSVIIQASKNVFSPGANFGAYSASKAGSHQLGKIAALELAPLGVRVNMVNADAVFGDDAVSSKLWDEVGPERMKSRGLDAEGLRAYYRERSLLGCDVTPAHVGAAVVFFASGATPTTGATLPVDGGVPGAFPR